MSYRIEITAASLAELAGKAASLAAKLNAGASTEAPIDPIMPEVREVAEAAPVNPTPAPKSAPVAETTESQPTTPEPSTTPAPTAEVPDFDAVVRAGVLKLVEVRGKPVAQEVLSRFGVAKASELSSDRWQELVDVINEELGQ